GSTMGTWPRLPVSGSTHNRRLPAAGWPLMSTSLTNRIDGSKTPGGRQAAVGGEDGGTDSDAAPCDGGELAAAEAPCDAGGVAPAVDVPNVPNSLALRPETSPVATSSMKWPGRTEAGRVM